MNFEREFLYDIAFRKLKKELGQDALEYVFRLWAKFEASKFAPIVLTDAEDMALLMDAPPELTGQAILDAYTKSGILVEVEPLTYTSPIWAHHNKGLIANWENGRKGGRPSKAESIESNSTEANQRKNNSIEIKGTEEKGSKVKGPVTPSLTGDKPNPNPGITQEKPNDNPTASMKNSNTHYDWENDSYENNRPI